MTGRRLDLLLAAAALALTLVPLLAGDDLRGPGEWVGAVCQVTGALVLALRSRCAVPVLVAGPLLIGVCTLTGPDPSDFLLPVLMVHAALAAEHAGGRAAWVAGVGWAAYLAVLLVLAGDGGPGLLVLVAPGFLAGTALRLRRETAEQLAARGRELAAERELFAELSVRNERARIASELHDIVGHALSVVVVQSAAGQRLAPHSPGAAVESLAAIADSARLGQADLQRLVVLLAGTGVADPDLSLVDELVAHAARSGLRVTCRLTGSREGLPADVAHAAVRVVQESLTNALRHAPGSDVHVELDGGGDRSVTVRVENGPATGQPPALPGTGRGLIGLRERVVDLGGTFAAGPAPTGGWAVHAALPGDATRMCGTEPARMS
ncbi:Histidine kinase [Klenkia soli]|uniref:histidine kinase n=1 Tax=Klenkia soli TaxID=1052260 RepID=A0A1H0C2T5_9ACTN|nr:histidine kinase [Klenkia soli]SDN52175.1 Histidine kinase [Klenkia soli]